MENGLRADTIVLIHGLWMTPLAWEHWVSRYERRGMKVVTPGYPGVAPGVEGVEALRRDPSPLANLGIQEVFNHLAATISGLGTTPIIMGHSLGGTLVQLLLDAGYGAAGVSINGAAVKGVKAPRSARSGRPSPFFVTPQTSAAPSRSRRSSSTTPSPTI